MCSLLFRAIVLTHFLTVIGFILHSTGPKHKKIAGDCLQQIIREQFHYKFGKPDENHTMLLTVLVTNNMPSPAHEIQENIIVKINDIAKSYQVEVKSHGKQYQFESFDECSRPKKEQEDGEEEKEAEGSYNCQKSFIIDFKTDFYVMVVDNENSFYNMMRVLKEFSSFNPRAMYLVYIEDGYETPGETAKRILARMWDDVLIRTAVLIPQSLQVLNLYRLSRKTRGPNKCDTNLTLVKVDSCVEGHMAKATKNYYGINSNKDYFNCSLGVISKPYEPFIINETSGFEIEVLQIIASVLNIHFDVTISAKLTDTWGEKKSNGNWSGHLKFVYEDYYLGIGNIETGMEYGTDFVSSSYYHMEPLVFVVPIAHFVPKWRVLIEIFTAQMWAICVGVIILFAITFYLSSKFGEQVKDFREFVRCFFTSFQIIINTSVSAQPTSDLTRAFFLSLGILSIIISSAYTSSLVYYLKNPIREHQPTTNLELLSEFGDLRYGVGGVSRYRQLFNASDSESAYRVFKMYQTARGRNDTVLYWINRVAQDRDLWTISSSLFANYLLSQNSSITTDERGRPKVFIFKQKLRSYSISIIMRKGHPLLKHINYAIKKLVWGGLVARICDKYKSAILRQQSMVDDDDETFKPLTMDHLQGAFALLLIGYLFGFVSLIIEYITKKITRKRNRKVNIRVK